jgi:hypothetical protein
VHLESSFADPLYLANSLMLCGTLGYHPVFKGSVLVNWAEANQPIQLSVAIPPPIFSPVSESPLSVWRELSNEWFPDYIPPRIYRL